MGDVSAAEGQNAHPAMTVLDAPTAGVLQALATPASKAIDTVTALGAFIGKILGTLPADAVGLIGDPVSHLRTRNADALQRQTDAILAARNATVRSLSLNVARPLFEAAQDESRNELQELWARLLANAVDQDRSDIRRSFIAALRQFDTADALVFQAIMNHVRLSGGPAPTSAEVQNAIPGSRMDEVLASVDHLQELKCLQKTGGTQGTTVPFTPFGRELARALAP